MSGEAQLLFYFLNAVKKPDYENNLAMLATVKNYAELLISFGGYDYIAGPELRFGIPVKC